ncbi:cutinase family protein [Nocardia vinacea]|uniref:cutinase family protein n=1 Tax=Nocardia vinacea TaxID=96468 RepID=UPI003447331C
MPPLLYQNSWADCRTGSWEPNHRPRADLAAARVEFRWRIRPLMPKMHARSKGAPLLRGLTLVFVASLAAAGSAAAEPTDRSSLDLRLCPSLFVLGVQGTGHSTPDTPVSVDDSALAAVLVPVLSAVGQAVANRAYVPYQASFGGFSPGSRVPYSDSAAGGLSRLRSMASEVVRRCPDTQLGLIGYSQGAHVVSMFAREVGAGDTPVPADRVAAVALFADPTRAPAAPVFPGAPGKDRPDPAPDTVGTEVAALPRFSLPAPPGGGIGPVRDIAKDFGRLTGRVASLCLPDDLVCDAPTRSPLLHMIVTIAGQTKFTPDDPVATLSSIADAIQATIAKTLTTVVNEDLHGYSLGTLSLTPEKTLSNRLAEAADPRVPADRQSREALLKLATAAFNTLLAISGAVLSSSELVEIASTAAVNPLTAMLRLGEAINSVSHRQPPRQDAFRLLTQIFDAIGQMGADNAELLDPHTWVRFADTVRRHVAYTNADSSGRCSTTVLSDWFTALARDLASHRLGSHSSGPVDSAPLQVSAETTPPPTTPPPADSPTPPVGLTVPTAVPKIGNPMSADAPRLIDRAASHVALLLLIGLIVVAVACGRRATRLRRAPRSPGRNRAGTSRRNRSDALEARYPRRRGK